MASSNNPLFLPSVFPSPNVVAQESANIVQYETKLSGIEESLAAVRATIKALADENKSLNTALVKSQSAMMPFTPSRIPVEILVHIFLYAVDGGKSPWILAQTCRAWRAAAFQNGHLWNRLIIEDERPDRKQGRWKAGWEYCHNVKLVEEALARSQNAPLDLKILYDSYLSDSDSNHSDDDGVTAPAERSRDAGLWRMLELVGGSQMARWRSLDFSVVMRNEERWNTFFNNPSGSLVRLEKLIIGEDAMPPSSFFDLMDRTCKGLRHVELPKLHLRPSTSLQERPCLVSIQYLHIRKPMASPAIFALFTSCRTIRTFKVISIDSGILEDDTFARNAANLDCLLLIVRGPLNSGLLTPSLVHLELDLVDNEVIVPYPASAVTLPNLFALKASGSNGIIAIGTLSCPNLQELYITKSLKIPQTDEAIKLLCDRMALVQLNPTMLKLRKIRCSREWLLALLSRMTSITALDCYPCLQPGSFWRSFYELNTSSPSFTCPSLRRFTVRGHPDEWQPQNAGSFIPILKILSRERRRLNMPVEIIHKTSTRTFHPPIARDFLLINGGIPVNGSVRVFTDRNATEDNDDHSGMVESEWSSPGESDGETSNSDDMDDGDDEDSGSSDM